MKIKKPEKFYTTTFFIGLGFFTMGLMDPLYDNFVPQLLSNFIDSKFVIGAVMVLDNIFALILIPIVSTLSDRTRTFIGRRMPYILVTLPLSAVFFTLLPFSSTLPILILIIFALNIFKQSGRGPVVSLMPDTISGEFRSEANGIINMMGGLAAIVGTVALAKLWDVSVDLPLIGNTYRKLPFMTSGILVIFAVGLLFLFVKEKHRAPEKNKNGFSGIKSILEVFRTGNKSVLFILLAIFFWFVGYQGILPFIGLYTKNIIGTSGGTTGLSMGMFAIAYAVCAVPSGAVGHKVGRKKVIRISLSAVIILSLALFAHSVFVTAPVLIPDKIPTTDFEKVILPQIDRQNSSDRMFLINSFKKDGDFYFLKMSLKKDSIRKAWNIINSTKYIDYRIRKDVFEKKIIPLLNRGDTRRIISGSYGKSGNYYALKPDLSPAEKNIIWDILNTNIYKNSLSLYSFWILLFLFGIFWAAINTNSFPMLWEMADSGNMGMFTGLYYFFAQAAAIAPIFTGFLIDFTGFGSIFLFSAIFMAIAFFLMKFVTKGEAGGNRQTTGE